MHFIKEITFPSFLLKQGFLICGELMFCPYKEVKTDVYVIG